MSRAFKTLVAAVVMLAAAPVALAEEPAPKQRTVIYADLDLTQPAGVETLMKRLTAASKRVCGKRPAYLSFGQMRPYFACRDQAAGEAVRRINMPAVTLAWQGEEQSIQVASR